MAGREWWARVRNAFAAFWRALRTSSFQVAEDERNRRHALRAWSTYPMDCWRLAVRVTRSSAEFVTVKIVAEKGRAPSAFFHLDLALPGDQQAHKCLTAEQRLTRLAAASNAFEIPRTIDKLTAKVLDAVLKQNQPSAIDPNPATSVPSTDWRKVVDLEPWPFGVKP